MNYFIHLGYAVTFILLAILSTLDLNPWYIILCSIPQSILGGMTIIFLATVCYVSDITNDTNRAFYMGLFDGVLGLGFLLGNMIGPYIFKNYGYTAVFSVAACAIMFAVLYTSIIISETVISDDKVSIYEQYKQYKYM